MEYLVLTLIGGSILFIIFLLLPIKIPISQKVLFVFLAIAFSHLFLWLQSVLSVWQSGLILILLILVTALGITKILYTNSEEESKDQSMTDEEASLQDEAPLQKEKNDQISVDENDGYQESEKGIAEVSSSQLDNLESPELVAVGEEQVDEEQLEEPLAFEPRELSDDVEETQPITDEDEIVHEEPVTETEIDHEDQINESESEVDHEEPIDETEVDSEEVVDDEKIELQELGDGLEEAEPPVEETIEQVESDQEDRVDDAEKELQDLGNDVEHNPLMDEEEVEVDLETPASEENLELQEIDKEAEKGIKVKAVQKPLNRELMDTLVGQLNWYKTQVDQSDFEQLVLDHAKDDLHDNDYYLFASILRDHYIETEQFDKLKNLLNKLKQRYNSKMVIKEEINFFENKFFQS